jgi:hypothetical protein
MAVMAIGLLPMNWWRSGRVLEAPDSPRRGFPAISTS